MTPQTINSIKSEKFYFRIAQAGELFKYGYCSKYELRERSWICLSTNAFGYGPNQEQAKMLHDHSLRGFELNSNYSL